MENIIRKGFQTLFQLIENTNRAMRQTRRGRKYIKLKKKMFNF